MPQQKPFIGPVQMHPEQEFHSVTHSAVPPIQPICTIKTHTVEISFFDGIDPLVVQAVMRGIKPR